MAKQNAQMFTLTSCRKHHWFCYNETSYRNAASNCQV